MPSLVCLAGTASFLLHDVSPHTNEPQTGNCCRPGDITVTQIPTGYLLGRALEQKGPGPWWSYILTVPAFDRAIELARNFAAHAQVQAWLHKSGDDYELLSDQILATSPELTAQQAEEARLDAWATELESRSAQMVAAYVGQMAPSGRITVALALEAADEMRRVQRAASRKLTILITWSCTRWNRPMGCWNCTRSREYSTESSNTARQPPTL